MIVLILSTQDSRYSDFKVAIRKTWGKRLNMLGIRYFFYEGGYKFNRITDDTIEVDTPDDLSNTFNKYVSSVKLLNNTMDYDYIFRTNLSSYIYADYFNLFNQKSNLNKMSYDGIMGQTNLIREVLYMYPFFSRFSGFINIPICKIKFVSGAGIYIGKDINSIILNSKPCFKLIDDVTIGLIMSNHVNYTTSDCVHIRYDLHEEEEKQLKNIVSNFKGYHYRLKNNSRKFDVKMMYKIDSIYY